VLVYGHYDVQPTGSADEWDTPPFELTVEGDVVRGRGVTDDKGPVFIVLTLARAFIAQRGALPLNVKFLIEGEEEIGSPNLGSYVRGHADELAADLVISADGAQWRPSEPSVSTASKGLVGLDIVVHGARGDLHSGRYGGTVANLPRAQRVPPDPPHRRGPAGLAAALGAARVGATGPAHAGIRPRRHMGKGVMTPDTSEVPERPYASYAYLDGDLGLPRAPLTVEFGRVAPYAGGFSAEEVERAERLLRENITISLHDHPVRFPADMADTPAYNRTGRQHTAFEGLVASGLTVVFDNMMDGTAMVTGNTPWQWDDVVTDLGMRQADLAHQDRVVVVRTVIPRLKADETLRAVADTGGVIGISAAPHTTISQAHPRHSIQSVLDHFRYCVDLVGIDHVTFGPDTLYGDHVGLHTVFTGLLGLAPHAGPPHERVAYVDGLENPTENFHNLAACLVRDGYSDEDIAKVLGGNTLRALRQIWV
jgi:hypothetical protein